MTLAGHFLIELPGHLTDGQDSRLAIGAEWLTYTDIFSHMSLEWDGRVCNSACQRKLRGDPGLTTRSILAVYRKSFAKTYSTSIGEGAGHS